MDRNALAKLNRDIKSLATRTAKWRDAVQLCLVGAACCAFEDHNTTPATAIVEAVEGADRATLIRWIEAHMPARWHAAEARFKGNKSFVGEYDAITLMSEPWWAKVPKLEQIASSFDVAARLRAVIAGAEKAAAKDREVIGAEALDAVRALVARLSVAEAEAADDEEREAKAKAESEAKVLADVAESEAKAKAK